MWVVIGFAGVTCGGKTTLCCSLAERLRHAVDLEGQGPNRRVEIIAADNYFFPKARPGHVRIEGLGINWELNSSIDVDQVFRDMEAVTNGRQSPNSVNFLFVDGHTILNAPAIAAACSLKYFFMLPKEECARRRQARKFLNPDKEGYFDKAVWPSHLAHKEAVLGGSGAEVIDGMMDPGEIVERVLKDIDKLLEQSKVVGDV